MKSLKTAIIVLIATTMIFNSQCNCEDGICAKGSGSSKDFVEPEPYPCVFIPQDTTITPPAGGSAFQLDKFKTDLTDSLTGNYKGWQYALGYFGTVLRADAGGAARDGFECDPLAMSNCNLVNIASSTKYFTAAATVRLLEENGLDIDVPFSSYLPDDWTIPSGVDSLSFRRLLTHTTGLESQNTDFPNTLSYEGLKDFVAGGIKRPQDQDGTTPIGNRYLNANFALMRIIIPKLWQSLPDCPTLLKNKTNIDDNTSKTYYFEYLKIKFFQPANVLDATLYHNDDVLRTLYYSNVSDDEGSALGDIDWRGISGGGGLFMSSLALVRTMGLIEGNDAVLSATAKNTMKNNLLGLYARSCAGGIAYSHGGDITSGGDQVHCILATFPNGVQVAVNVNSGGLGNSGVLMRMVTNVYNNCQ